MTVLIFSLFLYINSGTNENKVCFAQECFEVELASSQEEISRGLMFRESLDENSGMLFIFPEEGIYNFWMKNTLISLDMIWINSDKEIVFIKHDALPCPENPCETFGPGEESLYVLELVSGTADKIGLEIGDNVDISLK